MASAFCILLKLFDYSFYVFTKSQEFYFLYIIWRKNAYIIAAGKYWRFYRLNILFCPFGINILFRSFFFPKHCNIAILAIGNTLQPLKRFIISL